MSQRVRCGLLNYRVDWEEGLLVWEGQEPASWYLQAKGEPCHYWWENINSPKEDILYPSVTQAERQEQVTRESCVPQVEAAVKCSFSALASFFSPEIAT